VPPLLVSVFLFNDLDFPGNLFILYPRMERALKDAIRAVDIEGFLTVPEFQFKKKRVQLLRLLQSGSRHTTGLSTDLIRHVADGVLRQQDERSILAFLETLPVDERGILSRMRGALRSSTGEEELWLAASKRASSLSDSGFLSDLRTIPVDNYLHEAAIDVEEAAYAILAREVDTLVAGTARETIVARQDALCTSSVKPQIKVRSFDRLRKERRERASRAQDDTER
jgi:hypothetical protein